MHTSHRPQPDQTTPESANLGLRLQRNLRGIWLALALTIAAAALLYFQAR